MPTLRQHLLTLSVHDLRAIATRLNVGRRELDTKPLLLDEITRVWDDPALRRQLYLALSAPARSALCRLTTTAQLPAVLFWAEYGRIRPARRTAPDSSPPWRSPASVAEELYYLGLLHDHSLASLTRSTHVCTPADLRTLLASELNCSQPTVVAPPQTAPSTAWRIHHDAGQWLILAHRTAIQQGRPLRLRHGRWPQPAAGAALNRHLVHPFPAPLPQAMRSLPYLRLLMFLVTAAELFVDGMVTPLGWAWLAEPPDAQFALLWRAWLVAMPATRTAFGLVDANLPAPWPRNLLDALPDTDTPFTGPMVATKLLAAAPAASTYWAYHAESLTELDELVAAVLEQVLAEFAVVEAVPGMPGHWRMTRLGRWLIHNAGDDEELHVPLSLPAPAFTTAEQGWEIAVDARSPLSAQAILAAFALDLGALRTEQALRHCYRLTLATIVRAQSAGVGLPSLLDAFAALKITLSTGEAAQLAAWCAGDAVRLEPALLLRTPNPKTMQSILEDPTTRALIAEVLAPCTATVRTDAAHALDALHTAERRTVSTVPVTPAPPLTGAGALWLAGQIYQLLGSHLPLPLPAPVEATASLIASRSQEQAAVLAVMLAELKERLLDLLDGRLYAPAPAEALQPAFRTQLEQAAVANATVSLLYFTPARNLITQRPVTPYWFETWRGQLYLRAYCHLTDRVLLFRLDRIQSIAADGTQASTQAR